MIKNIVILNLFQDPYIRTTVDKRTGLRPGCRVVYRNDSGFTLIELLVVVLIIGILSAVALPQYRLAVAKSRLAGLVSLGRSLQNSQRLYYLANGHFTTKFDELDVTCEALEDRAHICVMPSGVRVQISGHYIQASDARVPGVLLFFYIMGGDDGFHATCNAYDGNDSAFANKVCKNLSGDGASRRNATNTWYLLWE